MESIDQKYSIEAVNNVTGVKHTSQDAVLFLAHDPIFLKRGLPAYIVGCREKKCSKEFIKVLVGLKKRIEHYQKEHKDEVKLPD